MRVVTRNHVVRSTVLSMVVWGNPNHWHIVADLSEVMDGVLERIVVHLGMDYDNINLRETIQ